jgi:hypothetical protein
LLGHVITNQPSPEKVVHGLAEARHTVAGGAAQNGPDEVIRIAITQAAFDAIAATLPVGKRRLPAEVSANSDYLIGLNQRTV